MTLLGFQSAIADLVASPALCKRTLAEPDSTLARYDLTPRDRRRLLHALAHRGMALNCSLYRANRLTVLNGLLPLSCTLLGAGLRRELDLFWDSCAARDLQHAAEAIRFAAHLQHRLASGDLADALLADVLSFELASAELQLLPRRRILADLATAAASDTAAPLRLHPLVRLVPFCHEPMVVLSALARAERPEEPQSGEFYVALDATQEGIEVRQLPTELARLLLGLGDAQAPPLAAITVDTLRQSRLVA